MSEPFLALFTYLEVFLSFLKGFVLRPLLFDFPHSTMQTERLNNCFRKGKVFWLPLSRYWNVPIKDAFCPNRRTLFPNGRMCFQSVDKVSLTKYDEDTIKQQFNCYDNRNKLREEFSKMKKTYKIEVDCANCANLMEDAARKTSGVQSATVNFMTQKMIVEFAEGQEPASVMDAVQKACKKVEPDCEIFL